MPHHRRSTRRAAILVPIGGNPLGQFSKVLGILIGASLGGRHEHHGCRSSHEFSTLHGVRLLPFRPYDHFQPYTSQDVDHFGELEAAFPVDHIGDPSLAFVQFTSELVLGPTSPIHDHFKSLGEAASFHAGQSIGSHECMTSCSHKSRQ